MGRKYLSGHLSHSGLTHSAHIRLLQQLQILLGQSRPNWDRNIHKSHCQKESHTRNIRIIPVLLFLRNYKEYGNLILALLARPFSLLKLSVTNNTSRFNIPVM